MSVDIQPAAGTGGAVVVEREEPVPAAPLNPTLVKKQQDYRRFVLTMQISILVGFLLFWELAVRFDIIDPFFYGQPSGIVGRLVDWFTEGTAIGSIWEQIWVTMYEAGLGFLIGSVLGIVGGIALGRNRLLGDIFSIYIKIGNSIPRVVLGSIFIVSFGLGLWSKVALAVVMVFFVVFGNAFQGVREVDGAIIDNARILGASHWQVTRSVVIPSALSWILASLHVSFGFALIGAIVGEFLGARKGMGLLIHTAQGSFDSDGVFAAMILIAVVALAAEAALTYAEHRLIVWRPDQRGHD